MKQCVNCGMNFGDTVTTCRFCGKVVRPVAEKPKPAPKTVPQYTECAVCHFKQAPGTKKCRFCGGICSVVNPSVVEEPKTTGSQILEPNKREQLKAQATELGLTFAANISTEKLEKMIVEALKAKEFTAKQNGENTDDNPGNNEADSTSSQGSGAPVDNQ